MSNNQTSPKDADYQKLVRQVADEVWRMWQAQLRRENERQGKKR